MISFRLRKKYKKNQPLKCNKNNKKTVFFLFEMYSNKKEK